MGMVAVGFNHAAKDEAPRSPSECAPGAEHQQHEPWSRHAAFESCEQAKLADEEQQHEPEHRDGQGQGSSGPSLLPRDFSEDLLGRPVFDHAQRRRPIVPH